MAMITSAEPHLGNVSDVYGMNKHVKMPSATSISEIPMISSGLRPARSTNAVLTPVMTSLTAATPMVAKAPAPAAEMPADWNKVAA